MLPRLAKRSILEQLPATSASIHPRRSYNIYPQTPAPGVERPLSSETLAKLSTLLRGDQETKLTDTDAEVHNHHLYSLHVALRSRNLVHVREAYEDLVNHSSSAALMARDFEEISRMLDKHFSKCSSVQDMIPGSCEMAIEAAARGHTEGLRACMLLHLKDGDFAGILSISSQFDLHARGQLVQDTGQGEQLEITEDLGDTEDASQSDAVIKWSRSDVADIVLTIITAHGAVDRFDDALGRILVTPISVRFPETKVLSFCRVYLSHNPSLSERIHNWTRRLVLLRLLSREASFTSYISRLGRDKNIVTLEKLYAAVIAECRKVDARVATDPNPSASNASQRGTMRKVVFPSNGWITFMNAFFKCHRTDLVEALWHDAKSLGLSPSRRMWTGLLDGYGRHGHCEKAMDVWNRMLHEGVEPDEVTHGAMTSAYFLARRPNEGLALFEQFRRGSSGTAKRKQNTPAMLPLYNIVLHGLCTNAWDDRARLILKGMVDEGPNPDIVSYNIFLRHYGRIGDMQGIAGVLRALKPAGLQPDVHSFTTILAALYKAGKPDAHTKTLRIMHTMGIQPNFATYSAVIDFLVRQGGEDNFRKAAELLQLMEDSPNVESRPNEVTYTALLAGIHRDTSISVDHVKLYTAELLKRMQKHGKPNRTTYHILIKACLENPETEGLKTALKYYREMEDQGIKLLHDTWYVLLAGLLRRRDLAIAGEVLTDMFKKGFEPVGALSTLVDRVQREIAAERT